MRESKIRRFTICRENTSNEGDIDIPDINNYFNDRWILYQFLYANITTTSKEAQVVMNHFIWLVSTYFKLNLSTWFTSLQS